VLNRRHAAIVSEDEETLHQFESKCFQHYTSNMVPSSTSCFGDEHYFATALAAGLYKSNRDDAP
jgi:hypothetical protein